MDKFVGVIPAAGRGVRAYPYTELIPKAMLEVDGVPIIRRTVELMRDQLDIHDIRIVIGHRGEVIQGYLGDGTGLGVRICYIDNPRIDLELSYSVYLGTREVDGFCCVILSDECYVDSNHRELLGEPYAAARATCGVMVSEHPKYVRQNYAVVLRDGMIAGLEEKPRHPSSAFMGTGTYVLHPDLVARLRAAFEPRPEDGPRDWTSFLGQVCADEPAGLRPFFLRGRYVNINSRDDLNRANSLVRELTFARRRKSLIFVVNQVEPRTAESAARFAQREEIDEVVVSSRGPVPGLTPGKMRAVVVSDPAASVGDLVKAGLAAACNDILLIVDSDETFAPGDVSKFLVYLTDADMVIGTRTTRQMLEQATNMRGIVRAAHLFLAKFLEVLWWRFDPRLTDTCCIYRALWRSTYEAIRPHLSSIDEEIYPEMIVEVMRARRRIIEIPVTYYNPDPSVDGVRTRYQSVTMFARIVAMIMRKRFQHSRFFAGRRRVVGAPAANAR